MMWTHFPFNIYVGYEFEHCKTLNIVLMCFDGKKQPLEKKQEKVQQ